MATLREIRRKIQSVGNIRKLTQAMELVAASRLRKAQAKAEASRPYALKLKEMVDRLIASSDELQHPLIAPRKVNKIGLVIIASDRGLCGAYNQNIFNISERFLRKHASEQLAVIPIGHKTVNHFAMRQWEIAFQLEEWGGKITYPEIVQLGQRLIDMYLEGQLDEIWMVYTHFVNVGSRQVRLEKFLNIDATPSAQFKDGYLFEPDAPTLLAEILPYYCITKLQSALNDAFASELAARISSMRAATKNAEEMIETLTLTRNKVRQAGITRELIEITSSVESLR